MQAQVFERLFAVGERYDNHYTPYRWDPLPSTEWEKKKQQQTHWEQYPRSRYLSSLVFVVRHFVDLNRSCKFSIKSFVWLGISGKWAYTHTHSTRNTCVRSQCCTIWTKLGKSNLHTSKIVVFFIHFLSFLVLQMKEPCGIRFVIYDFSGVTVHWFCWPRTKPLYLNWFSIQAHTLIHKSIDVIDVSTRDGNCCLYVLFIHIMFDLEFRDHRPAHTNMFLPCHRKCRWRWWNEEKISFYLDCCARLHSF